MNDSTSNNANFTEDFFVGVFENHWSKICFMTFLAFAIPVEILLLYSIIWCERYGLDVKRTVVNKLCSFFCWVGIQYALLVNIPDLGRYIFGPYSVNVCLYKKIFLIQSLFCLNIEKRTSCLH
jgi:hypothetical protein